MFDPDIILRPILVGLAELMQRRTCLVESILYSVPLYFLSSPMFDPTHYWDPYLGLQRPPALGSQTPISDYGILHNNIL